MYMRSSDYQYVSQEETKLSVNDIYHAIAV